MQWVKRNPCHAEFILGNMNMNISMAKLKTAVTPLLELLQSCAKPSISCSYFLSFYHFSLSILYRWLKFFLMEDKGPRALHSQYYGCIWPGDARSQGIINHGILRLQHHKGWHLQALNKMAYLMQTEIWIEISLKFVPKGPVDYKPVLALVWHKTGTKSLPKPMMTQHTMWVIPIIPFASLIELVST